jgi:hypothetical protein
MDWRNYMPDLGRFSGIDVLAESYADQSPSHFAQNNPVAFSDSSGMYSMDANGNISTSNHGEINELFAYFRGGGKVGGVSKFMSASDSFARDLPGVNLSGVNFLGKGNSCYTNHQITKCSKGRRMVSLS